MDVCGEGVLTACLLCFQGGFQKEMTKREAALILGLRESAAEEKVKDAHRRIMIANHPDAGLWMGAVGAPHVHEPRAVDSAIGCAADVVVQSFWSTALL